ncbi:NVL protein, partial [Polypterus senegalus]
MGSSVLGKAATLDQLLKACIDGFVLGYGFTRRDITVANGKLSMVGLDKKTVSQLGKKTSAGSPVVYWIVQFPAEFNLDLGLIRLTEEFREVAGQLGYDEHIKLIDISSIPSYDWMRRVTQRKKQSKKGKASLLFDHLKPIELAEHLTYLEYKSFRRISFTDYQSYVIHGCLVDNPTLERSIALFNGVSQWVQLMVLSKPTPYQRAEVITKFINVAQSWSEMTELVSSSGNYCNYRKTFAECEGFKIPILGVHLKDLIAVHVVFPDWIDESKVNIVKMQQLYVTFNELVSLQNTAVQEEPNMDLIHLLTLSLDLYYTEDEIYELSLLREPRNPKSLPTSPTSPNKPVVSLDWATGVAPKPDPTVISKHIRKVVDSVFRNYDHDHDGYISQEDFESITANFPFLDSFCVLDKDHFQCSVINLLVCNADCGVNCHKQCRDLLVLACRKLSRGTSLGNVSPTACTHGSLPSSPSVPPCNAPDNVFEFPGVTPDNQDLDNRSITLMTGSARKISVRLQRTTTSQATQTEPLWHEHSWGTGDCGSHTFPKMRYKLHSKNKGFASWENDKPPLHARTDLELRIPAISVEMQNGMHIEEEKQESAEVNFYSDRIAAYGYLHDQGIGTRTASLYLAWAQQFEVQELFQQADLVYQRAIENQAEPADSVLHEYSISKSENRPSLKQPQACQNEIIPMYCKDKLICGDSELCFEELRAQNYIRKCEAKTETQKYDCIMDMFLAPSLMEDDNILDNSSTSAENSFEKFCKKTENEAQTLNNSLNMRTTQISQTRKLSPIQEQSPNDSDELNCETNLSESPVAENISTVEQSLARCQLSNEQILQNSQLESTGLVEKSSSTSEEIDQNDEDVIISDPWNDDLITRLLTELPKPLDSCSGFFKWNHKIPNISAKSVVAIGDQSFQVDCVLGEGAFATVFQSSAIGAKDSKKLMLKNAVNLYKRINTTMPQPLVIYFAICILNMVDVLHSIGIIHADIKPDNFLLGDRFLDSSCDTENLNHGLSLIDFGQSIDMHLFAKGTSFTAKCRTSGFQCVEMMTDKKWNYQTDYYGIAGTVYCLLFGSYMQVKNENDVWKTNAIFKRNPHTEMWTKFFHSLVNVPDCKTLPVLKNLREELLTVFNENYSSKIKGPWNRLMYLRDSSTEYVDLVGVAADLQRMYSMEYGRRKRNAFRIQVERAYNSICNEADSTSLENDHLIKRARHSQGDNGMEEDACSIDSTDSDNDLDYPSNNHMNNSLVSLYQKGAAKSVTSTPLNKQPVDKSTPAQVLSKTAPADSGEPSGSTRSSHGGWFIDKTPSGKGKEESIFIDLCEDSQGAVSQEKSFETSLLESEKKKSKVTKGRKHKDVASLSVDGEIESSILNKKGKTKAPDLQFATFKFEDVGGNEETLKEVCRMLIHFRHPEVYQQLGVTPPRGFLLHGPPGCGKTLLAQAIAGELEMPMLKVAATELVSGVSGESEQKLRELFDQGVTSAPCILFIDEIDAITPKREMASKDMERRIVAQLLTCMDDLNALAATTQILVIGATNRPDSLDPALRRAGRFDREICLGIPDEGARQKILQTLCRKLKLPENFDFLQLARLTPGYVGADLMALCREAAMSAVNRVLISKQEVKSQEVPTITDGQPDNTNSENPDSQNCQSEVKEQEELHMLLKMLKEQSPVCEEQLQKLCIEMEDFICSLLLVQPSAKREGFATVPDVTWADIGALEDIREELSLAILAPVRNPEQFKALGLTAPAGILLAGPPGCGKTLLAKYVGESERAVRQVFQRARNSAPCVIFFDEIDALCPRRSDHESGASVRVVNQLLTEMDGLETRKQVFIMAATNRPDIIDPAVLRPGRLDKSLYVGLPQPQERFAILQTITKGTDYVKGADLTALVREASINALRGQINLTFSSTSISSGKTFN